MYGRSGKKSGNTVSKVITLSNNFMYEEAELLKVHRDGGGPSHRRRKHCLKAVEWGRHTNL